ncbi:bifunctional 2-polyprenyl-6-hydroxyphenol methylase/3-demethylubiquinol 3-O-methyltransferase UbiG [Piscirickettsia salmonis]|uniref:bifunctional 2-polyprenyl-6-hydroxyphenol methylase/3-demethylubiquinol 3-O-methyltransferase UbiG n=1 Tax=Piscirickettsia salmonis TaxID=1238 RepID=UPI0007C89596|nr:Ubiquinone biosynthesis O-methyltransferase [Piscirickettsiaceae bacterium NZ-RLO1]
MSTIQHLNVDQVELQKFADLAHEWWDTTGRCRPLHDLNPTRLNFVKSRVSLTNKNILDLGCGGGILSESLAKEGAQVTAIDMSKDVLNAAKLHKLESQLDINYQHISAEELAKQSPGKFEVITCMEMLEHVPDPLSILHACKTLLKPGGHLFISTMNRTVKSYVLGVIATEYILQLLPKGTHDHQQFIRPDELADWCRQLCLKIRHMSGVHYNPFTHKAKLHHDVSINYIAHITEDPL